jgi:hypothetical protein
MATPIVYRMHSKECSLLKENPELCYNVLKLFWAHEKTVSKAQIDLRRELKDLLKPYKL